MRWRAVLLVTGVIVVASCGGGAGGSTPATAVDNPVAGIAVATTTPRTTPPTVATTTIPLGPTTTAAPPAALPAAASETAGLRQPIAPPPDGATDAVKLLGRIEIPKLKVSDDMYEGIALSTLDKGPGHWPGSAIPGQPGNVVVAGHRVSHSKPFRHIDQLDQGDQVRFTVNDTVYTYVVTGHEIVDPTAIRIVAQTPQPTATLFACHPPGSVSERYVVYLKLQT